MVDSLFRSWKSAALLAVGVSTLAAAFFADGGGHESFEESAAQIRDRRAGTAQQGPVVQVNPGPVATPIPGSQVTVTEEVEPEFGAPMDGEPSPTPTPTPKPKPAAGEGEGGEVQEQPL